MSDLTNALAILQNGLQLLDRAETLEQIKTVRDKAEAIRNYAASVAAGRQIQQVAAELKLRAERKAGKMLSALKLWGGDRKSSSHDQNLKLCDMGIDHNQAARWKLEAQVPDDVFEEFLDHAKRSGTELTSQALLRLAKKYASMPVRSRRKKDRKWIRDICARFDDASDLDSATSPGMSTRVLTEIENHIDFLRLILEPVCEDLQVKLQPIDQRTILRLLHEVKDLLVRARRPTDDH